MSKLDFEQQRKRAKQLLRDHHRGDPEAVRRIQRHLPRAAALSRDEAGALALQLADAQLVVAREAGFPTWPRLKRHVQRAKPDEAPALHAAVRAGEVEAVRAALAAEPPPWQTREALEDAIAQGHREIVELLLEHGALVDRAGRRWGRWGGALHAALLLGRDAALIERLIAAGASLRSRDRDGRTPYAIAVRTGHAAAAAVLRRHGASDDEVDAIDRALGAAARGEAVARLDGVLRRSDHQQLCWAIRQQRADAVRSLLALGLDPAVPDDDGETPLHLAVAARRLDIVELLLAAGARVDALNYRDEPAVVDAMRSGDGAIVARLVAAGARRGDADDLAEPFEEAADAVVAGQLGRLRALLDRHPRLATLRSVREHRATLLHYAAANGMEQERQRTPPNIAAVVELLIARGADPNALAFTYGGGPGQTTLGLAITSMHPDAAGVMTELVTALVRGGARVDTDDGDALRSSRRAAWPALVAAGAPIDLWFAAALGRTDDVRRFVAPDGALRPGAKLGCDARTPDRELIDLALRAASAEGHLDIVGYLLAAGGRLDAVDVEGMTPLHHAVWRGQLEVVRFLVEHGAPLDAENLYGGTPLSFLRWVIDQQGAPPNADAMLRLLA